MAELGRHKVPLTFEKSSQFADVTQRDTEMTRRLMYSATGLLGSLPQFRSTRLDDTSDL